MTTRRYLGIAFVVFVALTAALNFPQVLHLRDGVHDDGDPLLNAWALSWVVHQLPRAPAHLFDANIFYPERRTLAYSETLLLPAAAAAPLRWMGAGPILVYNLVFLSGFAISGVGTALLVRSLTGSGVAGILSGIVFAFLPYRIDHYPHMQLQQTQCLPFAMWAFHRLLRRGRIRDGALFGALVAGQILSCMYYGLLLMPYFAVVCGTLWAAQRWRGGGAAWRPVLVAAVLIAGVTAPVGKAYLGAHKVVGERPRDEVEINGSAKLTDYLGAPEENVLYGTRLAPFSRGERRLFPGFLAVALALFGTISVLRSRSGAQNDSSAGARGTVVLAYLLGLLIAFDISLGFNGLTFRLLYEYVLPFRGLRIPARNGIIVGFSLAVLAGFGAARLRDRRWAVAIAALMLAEYASWHIPMVHVPLEPPGVYADILRDNAGNPPAAIFEFPVSSQDDPTYMYFATFHWLPLVNGYSGFFPPSYIFLVNAVQRLPDDLSLTAIKSHGARYLLVHGERLLGARYDELTAELRRRPELTFVMKGPASREGQHGEISVFRISYAESR
ncbi:MAG TPA: hypothetical protein VFB07_08125 [Vicinamibacterales bacterium]|nr:hypothetical protein [Vicinamibacterales bacterium]